MIAPRDEVDAGVAQRAIDAKTKPIGALGRLEDIGVRLSILQGTLAPRIDKTRVCVFGADHGVAVEGVSAYPREVTAEMMRNFDRGGAAINVLAAANAVGIEVIDVGVDANLDGLTNITHAKVRRGSRNFLQESAMTESELDAALEVGVAAARRAAHDGVHALGLGEMGIANTTAASALLSGLTGECAAVTVGRGTGIGDEVFARKVSVVDSACVLHAPPTGGHRDPRELLRCLGGLELAAIAGAAIEAARLRLAVVADGFISTVAVFCAARMVPSMHGDPTKLTRALFFAHRSAERGHALVLDQCGALAGCDSRPMLDLGMRLGEGSGAALAMPVVRSAAAIMREMATFASANVSTGENAKSHTGAEST